MRANPKMLLISAALAWTTPLSALPQTVEPTLGWTSASQGDKPVYVADAKGGGKKKPKAGRGVREKHITGEATVKGKDQTKVDFDAADIGGQRKTPMGTLINQNKADKNYDFVKIRLRWHPEMVQSASSLDSGTAN